MKPLIGITPEVEHSDEPFEKRQQTLALNYTEAIRAAGGIPIILPLTTDRATLKDFLHRCDGLLLTGGGDVAAKFLPEKIGANLQKLIRGVDETRDTMELFLARETLSSGKPILGICRGAQVMNVAAGGTLIVDIPAQIEKALSHKRKGGDAEHEIQIEKSSRLRALLNASSLRVNSAHHQAVGRLGEGFRATAHSSDDVIEAIENPHHLFALGLQCHPERLFRKQPKFLTLFTAFIRAARTT